jgi:hypothetical protein
MKTVVIPSFVVWAALACLAGGTLPLAAATDEGVALAIVYDTSGSMKDLVHDEGGSRSPKYKIANRALENIAKQLQAFAEKTTEGAPRKLQVGLYTFNGSGVREAVPFGNFNSQAIIDWARKFSHPGSGTPLGNALQTAGETVLKSDLAQKHVLILTDGINTMGPNPASVLPGLLKQAEEKHVKFGVYFVAFDIDANVFNSVKHQGAKVFSARDAHQLNTQLQLLLQREILLEEPEKPSK